MKKLSLLLFLIHVSLIAFSQLTAPGSSGSNTTNYPVSANDDVFIFCGAQGEQIAQLRIEAPESDCVWEKYNPVINGFEAYLSGINEITGLASGLYKVIVTAIDGTVEYQAWVFNNWIEVTASITESTCTVLGLSGALDYAALNYYDPTTGTSLELEHEFDIEWTRNSIILNNYLDIQTIPPPEDSDFNIVVSDQLGCVNSSAVTYESIVPKADFSVEPSSGEAPLTVTITNNSINADEYEWAFYKAEHIIAESLEQNENVDSIDVYAYNSETSFEKVYEETGSYRIKLTATKYSAEHTCRDSMYFAFVETDPSDIKVPWAFSPDANEENQTFYVRTRSMRSYEIHIFNRWGKKVHVFRNNNVRSSDDLKTESVWDGKIGGRYASPGVYYYVIKAKGRDDKKYEKKGFVHLFRSK